MRVLGISAFHRDAAAVLAIDGRVVAAAQEERFTRLAGEKAFPMRASRAVLGAGDVLARDLDRVIFYEKPLRKFERVLVGHLRSFPRSSGSFSRGLFLWLGDRLWIRNRIAADLGVHADRVGFAEHLQSLAAAAWLPTSLEEAAVLVVDDVGEWATTLLAHGRGASLRHLVELRHPHSLGLVASAITQFLGFIPGEEEHKVEALAAFGEPRFLPQLERWVPTEGAFFRVEPGVFRFEYDDERLYEDALVTALGPPRHPGQPLRFEGADRRDADLAASLQVLLEERVLALARELQRRAPAPTLCFAGALARNRRLVARIQEEGPFDALRVPFASGKAGGALGAALLAGDERPPAVNGVLRFELPQEEHGELPTIDDAALAQRLARGERIALVDGAMEFGPHSLDARVVLASARSHDGGDAGDAARELLAAGQHVERFLPVRVALPEARAASYLRAGTASLALARRAQVLLPATDALRAAAPSAVLPDGRVWPQVVRAQEQPRLARLLALMGERDGAPLLLLDDLRLRGAPLVARESEALEAFRRTTLDALVLGDRLLERSEERAALVP